MQPIFCKDSANERNANSFVDYRVQPIFCKDSANERNTNLFVDYRVQPIFCKDSANKANRQEIEGEYLGNKGSNDHNTNVYAVFA